MPAGIYSQTKGCTDPLAINYNKTATINDGSCVYDPAEVSPLTGSNLSPTLQETSGLLWWDDYLWTQNDDTDINLYKLDTINGSIINSFPVTGAINNDWEEISKDDTHLYIGDFGNNGTGNRTDLRILKIEKNSLLSGNPSVETIYFSYSDQTDLNPSIANKTDFDCEAFIVTSDSIYLFTKQWISNKTNLYALPKSPGTYKAKLTASFNVDGLITGATFVDSKNLVVLCGYSSSLDVPFVYLLYDFTGSDFFSGNKRKITIDCLYHQVEGISTVNGLKYYISNEYVSFGSLLTVTNKLQIIDLSMWLKKYFNTITGTPEGNEDSRYKPYPIPAANYISVRCDDSLRYSKYSLTDMAGNTVKSGILPDEIPGIYVADLPAGLYILKIGNKKSNRFKVIKN